MRKFVLSIVLLIVIFAYTTMHDRKKDFAPIDGSPFVSFTERINSHNLIGICDSNNVVLREARYTHVEGKGGFVVGRDAETGNVDIFLSDGDSVLYDVSKKICFFETDGSVPYLHVFDTDDQEYIVLQDGQVVGPRRNLNVCQRQKVVVSHEEYWGILSFDNREIIPDSYQKIVFVNRKAGEKEDSPEETAECLLALRDGQWRKFLPEGAYVDTVAAAYADSLLQSPSCEMQTGNAVFSVKLGNN